MPKTIIAPLHCPQRKSHFFGPYQAENAYFPWAAGTRSCNSPPTAGAFFVVNMCISGRQSRNTHIYDKICVFLNICNIRIRGLQQILQNTTGFQDSAFSGPFITSKDAILYDENRLFRLRGKVLNWVTHEGAPIGPKSKNQISNISRENKPKPCISTPL